MDVGGVDYAGEFEILELKLILPTGQILNLDKDLRAVSTICLSSFFSFLPPVFKLFN